jgi:hypothetical protein
MWMQGATVYLIGIGIAVLALATFAWCSGRIEKRPQAFCRRTSSPHEALHFSRYLLGRAHELAEKPSFGTFGFLAEGHPAEIDVALRRLEVGMPGVLHDRCR